MLLATLMNGSTSIGRKVFKYAVSAAITALSRHQLFATSMAIAFYHFKEGAKVGSLICLESSGDLAIGQEFNALTFLQLYLRDALSVCH